MHNKKSSSIIKNIRDDSTHTRIYRNRIPKVLAIFSIQLYHCSHEPNYSMIGPSRRSSKTAWLHTSANISGP